MNNLSDEKLKKIFKNNCVWGKLEFQHFKKAVSEILEEIERDTCKWDVSNKRFEASCGYIGEPDNFKNELSFLKDCEKFIICKCGKHIEVING